MGDLWTVFIAAIGFGFGGEAMRRYRKHKAKRRQLPYETRNAGFWTDSRVYHAEAIFAAMLLAIPFTPIILLTSADRPIWVGYAGLLAYAAAIYGYMRVMNMREPQ